MKYFNQALINEALAYPELIEKLEGSFCNKYEVPPELHYNYESGQGEVGSTLLLMPDEIKADLFELCKQRKQGRISDEEITSFISVGYALEDLAAAELVWEKYLDEKA